MRQDSSKFCNFEEELVLRIKRFYLPSTSREAVPDTDPPWLVTLT